MFFSSAGTYRTRRVPPSVQMYAPPSLLFLSSTFPHSTTRVWKSALIGRNTACFVWARPQDCLRLGYVHWTSPCCIFTQRNVNGPFPYCEQRFAVCLAADDRQVVESLLLEAHRIFMLGCCCLMEEKRACRRIIWAFKAANVFIYLSVLRKHHVNLARKQP